MKTIQLASGLEPQNIPKDVNGRKMKELLENCAKEDEKKMFGDESRQIREMRGLAKVDEEERIILDKTFALGKNIHTHEYLHIHNYSQILNRLNILDIFSRIF